MANPPSTVARFPPTKVLAVITPGSQTPDPDRAIRVVHAKTYPNQVWYFLASLIFLVSICHFINIASGYARSRRLRVAMATQASGPSSSVVVAPNATSEGNRGAISFSRLPMALGDTFRALSFRWTLAIGKSYTLNVMEVLLTATYIVICLGWSLINTTSTKGVKFDPHYYANIAGNIVSVQLPLVTALGMKNNIISLLTGISFDKLIYLHGMTARVLVILIWLHAGGRAALGLEGKVAVTVPEMQAGIVAGIALTLLAIISIRPIRDKAYEFFLIVHFVLAFICVLSAYFHAASLQFGNYIWPSFLLWGLDRFIRILRLVISAFTQTPPTDNRVATQGVKLDLLSSHFLRLTIPSPPLFHWRAGQSVYLTFPGISASPLEAHPFTIATIDNQGAQEGNGSATNRRKQLMFFIRVRDGLTKRLFNAVEADKGSGSMRVLVDGPYSSPPLFVGYDTVLLFAGGSGIAFTLPLFLDLIERSKTQGLACRRLTFVWTVRNLDHISWIQSELLNALRDLPAGLILNIHIFITGAENTPGDNEKESESLDDDTASGTEKHSSSLDEHKIAEAGPSSNGSGSPKEGSDHILALPFVETHQGRADLEGLIKDEIALAKDVMAVTVCGTLALAAAVRETIRRPRIVDILRGGPTISLHVEAFGSS